MRVVILGAGATGSLFGARLASAGHHVTLVGRPDHVHAIRSRGLRIVGTGPGTFSVDVAEDLQPARLADAVLLTVKSFDLAMAAEGLARSAPPRPTLLTQNGLGIETIAWGALARGGWFAPERTVVRAIHSVPATWVAPGIVRAAGAGEVVLPSPAAGEPEAPPVALFADLLRSGGFSVRTVGSFVEQVWRKAIVNAAINPVTALHGAPNGALLRPPLRAEALELLREAVAAAQADGMTIPEREAIAEFERIGRATADNRSSMLQDLERGRPTEVDALLGELVRRAERHGIDLPTMRRTISAIEARRSSSPPRPQG